MAFTRAHALVVFSVFILTCSTLCSQDPDYVLSFSTASGPIGSQQEVTCLFDDPKGGSVDGWQLAVCHDADLLSAVSAETGETTLCCGGRCSRLTASTPSNQGWA